MSAGLAACVQQDSLQVWSEWVVVLPALAWAQSNEFFLRARRTARELPPRVPLQDLFASSFPLRARRTARELLSRLSSSFCSIGYIGTYDACTYNACTQVLPQCCRYMSVQPRTDSGKWLRVASYMHSCSDLRLPYHLPSSKHEKTWLWHKKVFRGRIIGTSWAHHWQIIGTSRAEDSSTLRGRDAIAIVVQTSLLILLRNVINVVSLCYVIFYDECCVFAHSSKKVTSAV